MTDGPGRQGERSRDAHVSGEEQRVRVQSAITRLIDSRGAVVLDGGLATELEQIGLKLDTPLWSGAILNTDPEAIRRVHLSYLRAGAMCLTTATYQASIAGFRGLGCSPAQARALMLKSVTLAVSARDQFELEVGPVAPGCPRALIAGSIGPFGASLADGSEYSGNYAVSASELRKFHEPRWEILAASEVDLLACETIPSFAEAEVLRDMLQETPSLGAWLSFSCRDGMCICDGTPIRVCAEMLADCEGVVAIGVNCSRPQYITSLIEQVRLGAPNKHVVVYPNSGEVYDGLARAWTGTTDPVDSARAAREWFDAGARLIGGCCRTGPAHIAAIAEAVRGAAPR